MYPLTTINLLWAHLLQCLAFPVFPMPPSIFFIFWREILSYCSLSLSLVGNFLIHHLQLTLIPSVSCISRACYVCVLYASWVISKTLFISFFLHHCLPFLWSFFQSSHLHRHPPISFIWLNFFSIFFLCSFICCRSLILFYLEKLATVYWAKYV